MIKTTSCTPLNGYLPAELHRANYSLGMLPRRFVYLVLEAHNGYTLRRHCAILLSAMRNNEQTRSLVASPTTFVYLLMVSLQ
jgi:hypothetical protein